MLQRVRHAQMITGCQRRLDDLRYFQRQTRETDPEYELLTKGIKEMELSIEAHQKKLVRVIAREAALAPRY